MKVGMPTGSPIGCRWQVGEVRASCQSRSLPRQRNQAAFGAVACDIEIIKDPRLACPFEEPPADDERGAARGRNGHPCRRSSTRSVNENFLLGDAGLEPTPSAARKPQGCIWGDVR